MLANESMLKSCLDAKISDKGIIRTTANIYMPKYGIVMLKSEMLDCLMLTFDLGTQHTSITGIMLLFLDILKKRTIKREKPSMYSFWSYNRELLSKF